MDSNYLWKTAVFENGSQTFQYLFILLSLNNILGYKFYSGFVWWIEVCLSLTMACIEHYIKDAENIFEEIEFREK